MGREVGKTFTWTRGVWGEFLYNKFVIFRRIKCSKFFTTCGDYGT